MRNYSEGRRSESRKMNKISSSSLGVSQARSYLGIWMVLGLMALTLYMAFAFPYTLLKLKQAETTELKAVIVVGRSGEKSPSPESYFIGEEPPEDLHSIGYDQLTNKGKERMYLLGKYLKLRYYQLLLNGNPRKVYARSADTDKCLESTQALLAGLNPPKDQWIWSISNDNQLTTNWQAKAVHTAPLDMDDLLSPKANCKRHEFDKQKWKNSTRYQQLLNEFRHDLQTLRANTGLEFEDDLEMLMNIEDSLATRKAFKQEDVSSWYTSTLASRLAHISDVTLESLYNSANSQRQFAGRLLHEITNNIRVKIKQHQELLASSSGEDPDEQVFIKPPLNSETNSNSNQQVSQGKSSETKTTTDNFPTEPSVFIYMTNKKRLAALMNSLQIYTSQPQFGSVLLIELHYDPINQLHFLRFFTVSSKFMSLFPEPLRVNPIACVDSAECSPQQFEQNIRHLILDKTAWQEICHGKQFTSPFISTTESMPLNNLASTSSSVITTTQSTSTAQQIGELEKLDDTLIVGPTNIEPPASFKPVGQQIAMEQPSTTTTISLSETITEVDQNEASEEVSSAKDETSSELDSSPKDSLKLDKQTVENESDQRSSNKVFNHLTRDVYYPEDKLP